MTEEVRGQPSYIVAHTVKGKGVSFMENDVSWHGVAPTREQGDRAILEIKKNAGLPLTQEVAQ